MRAGAAPGRTAGALTVLVVEDDDRVREVMQTALEAYGYTVLAARHGAEALAMIRRHPGRLDLLVADVIMPELGGHALAERLAVEHPEVKVLLVSGHPDDVLEAHGVLRGERALLRKPFTPSQLLARARELLGAA
jgi:two-component system cell cycle sensor histidine kinase/response regulator CckA